MNDRGNYQAGTRQIDYTCERCGAEPGHLCRNAEGWAVGQVHTSRIAQWRDGLGVAR